MNSKYVPLILKAIGERPLALAISGSAALHTGGPSDIDVIALVDGTHRSRLRHRQGLIEVDVFIETRASIAAELVQPRRGAIINMLSSAEIIWDSEESLAKAKTIAASRLSSTPPGTIFKSAFATIEPLVDAYRKYNSVSPGATKRLLRAAVIISCLPAACFRLRIWPQSNSNLLGAIEARDPAFAEQFACAVGGDDEALSEVCMLLIGSSSATRRSMRVKC